MDNEKICIKSIQVSMYPKKTDIQRKLISMDPSIHVPTISKYPLIQVSKKKSVSKTAKYPDIRKKWYLSIPIPMYITKRLVLYPKKFKTSNVHFNKSFKAISTALNHFLDFFEICSNFEFVSYNTLKSEFIKL